MHPFRVEPHHTTIVTHSLVIQFTNGTMSSTQSGCGPRPSRRRCSSRATALAPPLHQACRGSPAAASAVKLWSPAAAADHGPAAPLQQQRCSKPLPGTTTAALTLQMLHVMGHETILLLHLQQSSPLSVPHAAVTACSHKAASPVIQIAFILHCNPKRSAMVARRNVWKLQCVESSHAIQDSIQQNGKRCHVCKRRASRGDVMIARLRYPSITVEGCCLTFGYACILHNRSKQPTAHSVTANPAPQSPRHACTQLHNAGARCR